MLRVVLSLTLALDALAGTGALAAGTANLR
jgi:hypothetical protein